MNQVNRFHINIGNLTFGLNTNKIDVEKVHKMIIHALIFKIYLVMHIRKAQFCNTDQIHYKWSEEIVKTWIGMLNEWQKLVIDMHSSI